MSSKKKNGVPFQLCLAPCGGKPAPPEEKGLAAYGGYNSHAQDTVAVRRDAHIVEFAEILPSKGLGLFPQNRITIEEAGDYQILFRFAGASLLPVRLTLEIFVNGNALTSSQASRLASVGSLTMLDGVTIVSLERHDVVDLRIRAALQTSVSTAEGAHAYLILNKLG